MATKMSHMMWCAICGRRASSPPAHHAYCWAHEVPDLDPFATLDDLDAARLTLERERVRRHLGDRTPPDRDPTVAAANPGAPHDVGAVVTDALAGALATAARNPLPAPTTTRWCASCGITWWAGTAVAPPHRASCMAHLAPGHEVWADDERLPTARAELDFYLRATGRLVVRVGDNHVDVAPPTSTYAPANLEALCDLADELVTQLQDAAATLDRLADEQRGALGRIRAALERP